MRSVKGAVRGEGTAVNTHLPASSPRLLRRLNSAHVLRAIRASGPISRADLARQVGLSKPTVNEVVEELLAGGLVVESAQTANGRRPARPGRPARLLRFRSNAGHVVGIDIGANKLLVLVADLDGAVVESERRIVSDAERSSAASLLRHVRSATAAALARAGVSRADVQAAGVGTPGIVDPGTGRVTLAPQLRDWEGVPLGLRLRRSFTCPVLVDNEVHLSLIAERWRGAARDVDNVLFLQVGYGIGAGLLIEGRLYRGANGAAGEIGYLPIAGETVVPHGLGPFEHAAGGAAYARLGSAAATTRRGRRLLELAGGNPASVDAEVVFAAAREGDPCATEIVDLLVSPLASGLASAVTVLNPEVVIVGGGLSRAGAALLDRLAHRLGELVPVVPKVRLSDLGEESVALGAVRLAVQAVDERLLGIAAEAV